MSEVTPPTEHEVSGGTPDTDTVKEKPALEERVKKLERNGTRLALLATVAGLLLGGGGVFGAVKWWYAAPLDRGIKANEAYMKSLEAEWNRAAEQGDEPWIAALKKELVDSQRIFRRSIKAIQDSIPPDGRTSEYHRTLGLILIESKILQGRLEDLDIPNYANLRQPKPKPGTGSQIG